MPGDNAKGRAKKRASPETERRTQPDRRAADDRREFPPRPEGRRVRGRRASDAQD